MIESKIYTNGVGKNGSSPEFSEPIEGLEAEEVEILQMYLDEIGKNKEGFLNNIENGKKVLDGELALVQLKKLSQSGLLPSDVEERVKNFIGTNTTETLLSAVEISLNSSKRSNVLEEDGIAKTAKSVEKAVKQISRVIKKSDSSRLIEVAESKMASAKEGISAYELLVEHNLRLAFNIAKKYQGRGLSLLELVSFANEGLMRSAAKYNWQTGYEFSTYATWWIKQCISRGLNDTVASIRLPEHAFSTLKQTQKAKEALEKELERTPTLEEIAERAKVDSKRYKAMVNTRNIDSLNRPVNLEEGGSIEFGDTIAVDGEQTDVHLLTIKSLKSGKVRQVINNVLTERERGVIELRFGIGNDGRSRTLEEVGLIYKVTRERVRQIEARAFRKLKDPEVTRELVEFI